MDTWAGGRGGFADSDSFFFRTLPAPKIYGNECIGLAWNSEKTVAIWLEYWATNAQPEIRLHLLKVVSGWALEFSKLIVLDDFSIYADDTASSEI